MSLRPGPAARSSPPRKRRAYNESDAVDQCASDVDIWAIDFNSDDLPGKRGRPRYDEQYPLSSFVEEYITQCHPGAADEKRHNSTCFTTCSIPDIKKYVWGRIRDHCRTLGLPPPKHLPTESTVRRQGVAPNSRVRAAEFYAAKVNFRTAPRRCDLTRFNPDFHYSASDVKTLLELSSLCCDEVLFMSCDNKNKIRLGAPANCNRTRPRGMYMLDNQPSLPDHSFPAKGAFVVPMGYMEIVHCRGRVRHESLDRVKGFKYVCKFVLL